MVNLLKCFGAQITCSLSRFETQFMARLMTSLTMMGLTPGPLVHTILPLFLYVFTTTLIVLGAWSGIFVPTGVESKCDIFAFFVFVPIGVESKGGQLIEMFWRSNYLFSFQI